MADESNDIGMTPMSDKEILNQDLAIVNVMSKWKQKLSRGEHIKVKISDKGMMPTINMGDVAEVVPVQTSSLKNGTLVFLRQKDSFVVRRIVETIYSGRGEFKVKGDNQVEPEPNVPAGNVLGKVITVERDGQRIELEKSFASTLNQLNKKFGGSDAGKASRDLEKGKEMAATALQRVFEFFAMLKDKITIYVDELMSKIMKK